MCDDGRGVCVTRRQKEMLNLLLDRNNEEVNFRNCLKRWKEIVQNADGVAAVLPRAEED